ncbi:hypothetical protein CFP56_037176 [Quercus suber]|uniref:Reverse transcriptase n=1 Tax=Quercus suber TaxID=58331 RepID=A0AAW0LPN3_QUESU
MVCELLKEGGKEWDIELVRGLFLKQDVEAILSTPISESVAMDKMVWAKEKKGSFTMRSTCRLAWEVEAAGGNAGCSDSTKLHRAWRGTCNGILATKDSFFCRKITANNICEEHGRHVETAMHLLCFCDRSTEVWSSCKLSLPIKVLESWSFLDTISRLQICWEAK